MRFPGQPGGNFSQSGQMAPPHLAQQQQQQQQQSSSKHMSGSSGGGGGGGASWHIPQAAQPQNGKKYFLFLNGKF